MRFVLVFVSLTAGDPELPALAEGDRFADSDTCEFWLKFSGEYLAYLERQRDAAASWQQPRWTEALAAARWHWQAWWHLAWARWPKTQDEHRRWHLQQLREWIGPDAYYRGVMPPPVPLEQFSERGPTHAP